MLARVISVTWQYYESCLSMNYVMLMNMEMCGWRFGLVVMR